MPPWPALSNTLDDSHLDLFKDRNDPDDETKTRKQRDALRVGRADARHKRLFSVPALKRRICQQADGV